MVREDVTPYIAADKLNRLIHSPAEEDEDRESLRVRLVGFYFRQRHFVCFSLNATLMVRHVCLDRGTHFSLHVFTDI